MKYIILLLPILTGCAAASGVSGVSAYSYKSSEADHISRAAEDRIIEDAYVYTYHRFEDMKRRDAEMKQPVSRLQESTDSNKGKE